MVKSTDKSKVFLDVFSQGFQKCVQTMFEEAYRLNVLQAAQTVEQRNEAIWKARDAVRKHAARFEPKKLRLRTNQTFKGLSPLTSNIR